MYKVGIIGGGGYTAGELIRLILAHPSLSLAFVQSQSQANKLLYQVHQDLIGESDLKFIAEAKEKVDVLFLCTGHGRAKEWLATNPQSDDTLIIDLSRDFRWESGWTYGLPELQKVQIQQSRRIANPGCFATAIQLALLPLAAQDLIQSSVQINALTGSTGAGQKPSPTSHFAWRQNNVSVYKPFQHQHLGEITHSLAQLQPENLAPLYFLPLRGGFTRGIFASIYLATDLQEGQAQQLFQDFYQSAAFTFVTTEDPHLKQVVNTNKCLLYPTVIDGQLLMISIIDNLLKGAAGQAIQNMNLALGLDEKEGLALKANYF